MYENIFGTPPLKKSVAPEQLESNKQDPSDPEQLELEYEISAQEIEATWQLMKQAGFARLPIASMFFDLKRQEYDADTLKNFIYTYNKLPASYRKTKKLPDELPGYAKKVLEKAIDSSEVAQKLMVLMSQDLFNQEK